MSHDPVRPAALLSVSDKRGIVELASALAAAGLELLSTGGTARALRDAGLAVTEVSAHTGADEMMDGRVKTLHPIVHGGILGRRGVDDELMRRRGIAPIDVVVVNLYPFQATVARADATFEQAVENIDIGGPAMLRSAAKNHASVMVLTDPSDYARAIDALHAEPAERAQLRYQLAIKAFGHTARYDAAIAEHFSALEHPQAEPADFPTSLHLPHTLVQTLRYGENPHQRAAFYRTEAAGQAAGEGVGTDPDGTLGRARAVQGKPLSYNNVVDADAALACVRQFDAPACVIVKHANPCGAAIGATLLEGYEKAWRTDPTSAFGGIIAFNRPLDGDCARAIVDRQFVEVVIAPSIDDAAREAFADKPNVRVLEAGALDAAPAAQRLLKRVSGGLLVQDDDTLQVEDSQPSVVTRREPSEAERADLLFCWRVAKFVKSNAIVFAHQGATVGVGAGQMSRVYSARIAAIKAADASLSVEGSVMASDAFFPFRDGLDGAAAAGVRAVIQPGGSKNDAEVIEAADEHDIAMLFTGVRHFRH